MIDLDFVSISQRLVKKNLIEIFPKFIIKKSQDLMIRGADFYAIYNPETKFWSTEEDTVIFLIDKMLDEYYENHADELISYDVSIKYMWDSDSGSMDRFHKYCQKQVRDYYHQLDDKLIFLNQEVKKDDYASKTLPYPLEGGSTEAWDEMVDVLYAPDQKFKIEWTIGAIVSGDSKEIQKMIVFYGLPGTGKSTIMNVMQSLFEGYWKAIDAKTLGSATNEFALEQFKTNPLVGICHDTDLSHIDNNERLNSLISHETMNVNEKHKSLYTMAFNTFVIVGSNKPVRITDAKSGIIRRLIDISPTNNLISRNRYKVLNDKIKFELSAIAEKCLRVYQENTNAFDDYVAEVMLEETNDIFNFMNDNLLAFKDCDYVQLTTIWDMYNAYCEENKVKYPLPRRDFKNEIKNYFNEYHERFFKDEKWLRSVFVGFKANKFDEPKIKRGNIQKWAPPIDLKEQDSFLDMYCKDCIAQYATVNETPLKPWADVKSTLKEIDTRKLHYLKVPENLIVIDFDIRDEFGNKSLERNLAEAAKWPETYTETSKSGGGIHLHYLYSGDVTKLKSDYDKNIEIKVFTGGSSLRRKLTVCNDKPIASISSGLPLKEEKTEKVAFDFSKDNLSGSLRTMIKRGINKEYHSATVCNVSMIYDNLENAFKSGYAYDVTDMYMPLHNFAMMSTHQASKCVSMVEKMHLKSATEFVSVDKQDENKPFVVFDFEVVPNVVFLNWKIVDERDNWQIIMNKWILAKQEHKIERVINPDAKYITEFIQTFRLIGYNNRRYDNHIMHAIKLGWNNEQLYNLSKKIVNSNGKNLDCFFAPAYCYSYTDVFDYTTIKQSLKKWEIQLGLHHMELGLDWNKPVPEELWSKVSAYCDNDVISTEAVWWATQDDYNARCILADLAGLSVNDTTNALTTKIIYGDDKHPVNVYTDLSQTFPGYEFIKRWNPDTNQREVMNLYRGTDLGFGGYVYAKPGTYYNVALLDVESMHPHSAIALNYMGKYTKRFEDLVNVRLCVKHGEYEKAYDLFDGKLKKYLTDKASAKKLSKALKIPINSVYGLTSAKFVNAFTCPENENNIVALRGALFMRTLQDKVIEKGFDVVHIKTDSIKIPNATPEIIQFCMNFAEQYGYKFEHEATYKKMCLVNDAVYIAKYMTKEEAIDIYGYAPEKCNDNSGQWTATGTQFAVPYVFKKCFSHDEIEFDDMCETKQVNSAMYLRDDNGNLKFVGRVGLFCPMLPAANPCELLREGTDKDGNVKYDAVVGTKGYKWLEAEDVINNNLEDLIDISYYTSLVTSAKETLEQNGADYDSFTE